MGENYETKISLGTTTPDRVQPPPEDMTTKGDFSNFENLAAKLVQVPKSEIDAKRRKA